MSRTISSLCIAGMASLALLTPSAAHAAGTGAQGDANAITVSLFGESGDSGTVRATNNGSGEQKTGDTTPELGLIGGQDLIRTGVLVQDAMATNDGTSVACAGIAGDESAVVRIGDNERCITEEGDINIDLVELDLTTLLDIEPIAGNESLGTVLGPLGTALEEEILTELQAGLDSFNEQGLTGALSAELGALEASCTYADGDAEGTTFLADLGLGLTVGEQNLSLITSDFDPQPAPNTKVVTELDAVANLLIDELEDSLRAELAGVAGVTDEVQTNIINAIITDELRAQVLQQVEDNLIDITLNKQDERGRSIRVTGLEAVVLPNAEENGAPAPLLDLDLANVGCGPFRGIPGTTDGAGNPVPTVVNAGEDSMPWAQSGLLGLMALLVGGGTVVALRRARS